MNPFTLITLILLTAMTYSSVAQTNYCIQFEYDAAGNRIKRKICTEENPPPGGGTGKTSEAETLIIHEHHEPEEPELDIAMLYPNPTSAICIITLTKPVENATLQLFDLQGRRLQHRRVSGSQFECDLSRYTPGTYLVVLNAEERKVDRRVVKE